MMLLNGVLAILLIFAGFQWRSAWLAAKDRERRMLSGGPKDVPKAQWAPLQAQPPVLATGYNDVAQKLLLHPSRNPNLPPPEPPPAPPPPPPEPMPALPKYHGTMNLDGQQVAILSVGNNPFQEVAAGGMIGPFKLVDVNTRDITYEWKGQQVRKTLRESIDRTEPVQAATNNAPAANAAPPPPAAKSQIGPVGETSAFGTRNCDPNDSYADGSVVNGFRKISTPTPFGNACRWEQVGK
jgi:hypothetical protein